MCNNEKINVPNPIEIGNLRIGHFAAQIEYNHRRLIPGTMAEGDQRKIFRLVVGSDYSWVCQENFKNQGGFLW